MLPNVLSIECAWVFETVCQRDRKMFVLNPNRRMSCVYASSNLLGWDLMISIAKTPKIFVGVDVSKATLDVY